MTTKEQQQLSPETRAKIIMLERGLTPRDVANGTGFCLGYVQRLFNGHIVTERGRRKIEEFFGCPIWRQFMENHPNITVFLTGDQDTAIIESFVSEVAGVGATVIARSSLSDCTRIAFGVDAEQIGEALELITKALECRGLLSHALVGLSRRPSNEAPADPADDF